MTNVLQKARLKFKFPSGDAGRPQRDAVSAAFYALRTAIGTTEHPEVMGSPWDWRLTASEAFKIETDKLREHVRLCFSTKKPGEDQKPEILRLKELLQGLEVLQEPAGGTSSEPKLSLKKNGPLVDIGT